MVHMHAVWWDGAVGLAMRQNVIIPPLDCTYRSRSTSRTSLYHSLCCLLVSHPSSVEILRCRGAMRIPGAWAE